MGLKRVVLAVTLAAIGGSVPAMAQKLQQIGVQGIQPHSLFGESIGMSGRP